MRVSYLIGFQEPFKKISKSSKSSKSSPASSPSSSSSLPSPSSSSSVDLEDQRCMVQLLQCPISSGSLANGTDWCNCNICCVFDGDSSHHAQSSAGKDPDGCKMFCNRGESNMSNDFCQAICHAFHLVQQFSPSGNVQFQPHADGHEKGFNHGPCHSQEVSSPGRTTEF